MVKEPINTHIPSFMFLPIYVCKIQFNVKKNKQKQRSKLHKTNQSHKHILSTRAWIIGHAATMYDSSNYGGRWISNLGPRVFPTNIQQGEADK